MRKFSSYGPINTRLHYYVPRQDLVDSVYTQLVGERPEEGGHYITVWAPRQRGKTWIMQQVVKRITIQNDFEVTILTLQSAKNASTEEEVFEILTRNLSNWFGHEFPKIKRWDELPMLFTPRHFTRPLILILDEFDALEEVYIRAFANQFRDMYLQRMNETAKLNGERSYMLHGLALTGVRAVLGVENTSGSPFNVQRSVHIPNLSKSEVNEMYDWYTRESGQPVTQAVINQIFYETQGQPGLVSWLGELLTETYNTHPDRPITTTHFEEVFGLALNVLPNNNLLNITSKARQEPYKGLVLDLFRTRDKVDFRYEDPLMNFLYLNGVIDWERESAGKYTVKFSSPLVQKRLFQAFATEMFRHVGQMYTPFTDLSDTITENTLNVTALLRRYEVYLHENREWLLRDAPRRATDLRIYEAVYHFNLYAYLEHFLQDWGGQAKPEFPTGNGQVDLLLEYAGKLYAIEVKSFSTGVNYRKALKQAAWYGQQLGLKEITLALFVEQVDEANRARYEVRYVDEASGVMVKPVFVEIG